MADKNPIRSSGSSFTPIRTRLLQRKCACGGNTSGGGECQECKKKTTLQRAPIGRQTPGAVPSVVHNALRTPGQPLDEGTRSFMEPRLGHDFSHVRVHTDEQAAESARAVNALAYTVGSHVFLDRRHYEPNTNSGLRLMAHELAHVVQQHDAGPASPDHLVIGDPASAYETQAEKTAADVLSERSGPAGMGQKRALSVGNQTVLRPTIQRQLNLGLPPIHMASDSVEIAPNEDAAAAQPKLQRLAAALKAQLAANPGAYITLSSYLSKDSELSSTKEVEDRKRVSQHMGAIRDALVALGVPANAVTVEPPTAFSTSSGGVITASLYSAPKALPPLPGGPPVSPTVPPAKGTPSPSLSDLLTFKFSAGGVQFTAALPKSVAAKLPVALSAAKTLSFELKAESSLDFSFAVTLDGLPHLKVVAKASLHYDKDKQTTSGGASVEFQATRTVCSASDPEALKAKIKSSGDKLKTAMDQLGSAKPDERLGKLADIASAIADMYDAVDKSKSACKQVPTATFNIGVQGPLSPDPDPTKRQPSFIGGTLTIPF